MKKRYKVAVPRVSLRNHRTLHKALVNAYKAETNGDPANFVPWLTAHLITVCEQHYAAEIRALDDEHAKKVLDNLPATTQDSLRRQLAQTAQLSIPFTTEVA